MCRYQCPPGEGALPITMINSRPTSDSIKAAYTMPVNFWMILSQNSRRNSCRWWRATRMCGSGNITNAVLLGRVINPASKIATFDSPRIPDLLSTF